MTEANKNISRRNFCRDGLWSGCLAGIVGAFGLGLKKTTKADTVWQIDPAKCIQCGNCATYCVLSVSAVKCVHSHAMCGYCDLCTGYLVPEPPDLNTGAENELCPTAAIKRSFVEDPYYEYIIDEELCIGCGKCVKGCAAFGNGSLYLQVLHNRCVNCNECSIAAACPSQAFTRVPADKPYLLKGDNND